MLLTKSDIAEKLKTDDLWLIRGILAIYSAQTADEQRSGETKYKNGVGFSGVDSSFLSSLATQVLSRIRNGRIPANVLSPKQLSAARKCMVKYSGQLSKIASSKPEGSAA